MATRYELSQFLTTQSQMLQVQHHVGGTPATIGNNIQVSAFKVAWLYLASDVSSLGQIHGDSLFARLENFTRVLKQFDLMDLLNLCSAGVELLLSHDVLTYETFKGFLVSTADSELVEGLLSPISPILCRYYDDAREDSEALKLCLQFLRYGKKTSSRGHRPRREDSCAISRNRRQAGQVGIRRRHTINTRVKPNNEKVAS